eukprot:gene33318-44604_t
MDDIERREQLHRLGAGLGVGNASISNATSRLAPSTGFATLAREPPAALITTSSESALRLLSVNMPPISRANGAMMTRSNGTAIN